MKNSVEPGYKLDLLQDFVNEQIQSLKEKDLYRDLFSFGLYTAFQEIKDKIGEL